MTPTDKLREALRPTVDRSYVHPIDAKAKLEEMIAASTPALRLAWEAGRDEAVTALTPPDGAFDSAHEVLTGRILEEARNAVRSLTPPEDWR